MFVQNEELFYAFIAGTVILFILALVIVVVILLHNSKILRANSEKNMIMAEHETELLKARLEIQEQTLTYISEEIHDNIGQVLSFIKVQLGSIEVPDHKAQERINESFHLLTKVVSDLRDLSRNLNTDYIAEKGFILCLDEELTRLQSVGGYIVNLSVKGDYYNLPAQKELILFRIAQELFNNILKHANGNEVNVTLLYLKDSFRMEVSDNGVGFDSAVPISKSLGIQNLKKRTRLLDGTITFNSKQPKGSDISVEIPISDNVFTKEQNEKSNVGTG